MKCIKIATLIRKLSIIVKLFLFYYFLNRFKLYVSHFFVDQKSQKYPRFFLGKHLKLGVFWPRNRAVSGQTQPQIWDPELGQISARSGVLKKLGQSFELEYFKIAQNRLLTSWDVYLSSNISRTTVTEYKLSGMLISKLLNLEIKTI